MQPGITRRHFLALLPLVLVPRHTAALGAAVRPKHPEPRPGITAAGVLAAGKVHDPKAAAVFDLVREIPQVVDGIRCSCGCAETKGYYSLLSCYEAPGMAQHCDVCQGQAKLAYRLHRNGWSLAGIRRAIDAQFAD